jgi:hypothetical protein
MKRHGRVLSNKAGGSKQREYLLTAKTGPNLPAAAIDAFFTIGRINWGGLARAGDFLVRAGRRAVA